MRSKRTRACHNADPKISRLLRIVRTIAIHESAAAASTHDGASKAKRAPKSADGIKRVCKETPHLVTLRGWHLPQKTGKRRRNKNTTAPRARRGKTERWLPVLRQIKKQMQIAPRYLERETRGTNHRRYLCLSGKENSIPFGSLGIAISLREISLRNE